MIDDPLVWPLLTDLASCLCRQITELGLPEPCFCGVLSGDSVALDYCQPCGVKCGMAWVRLAGIVPQSTGTQISRSARGCPAQLEVSVEVGIARCAPVADARGNPPTMDAQLDAARLQAADMNAARRAVQCCFDGDATLDAWAPLGPQGGCIGGAWLVTVEVG